MNSFFRMIACLAAICLTIPSLVFAEAVVSINPAVIDSPLVGEKLVIDVNISNAENVSAYQLNLKFDAIALSFVGVEFSDYLPGDPNIRNLANIEVFLIEPNGVQADLATDTATLAPPIAAASLIGVGANEGTNQRGDFGHLPRLDRYEDSVDGADVARRVRCLGVRDCEVSLDAAYQKAVSADGLEVGAPRDERHVLAGAGQAATEVAADAPGPVYSKSHDA